jgi:energy-coupling factor transporter ATP-binding protein EcfA2
LAGVLDQIAQFGRIDAESEAQLADFFLRTDAYSRIEDQEHIIVVGRKGTGKTAIYKALLGRTEEEYENAFVSGLQFRDYPWGTHQEVKDNSAAPVERYAASWRFLILVETAKAVLTSDDHRPPPGEATAAAGVLADFITTNWGELNFRFSEIFSKRQYSFKAEPRVMGNQLGSLEVDKVPRDRLAGFLSEANRWLEECLARVLTEDRWYYVLFDDLDRGYDPTDEEYVARLTGLLLAARDVYEWARGLRLEVAPVVFIRSDIYDNLSFPDKNKLTQNLVETLTWTDHETGENSLRALIEQRIRVITGTSVAEPWYEVFGEQVMRGTQHKFKHMAARTYLRPRDMIQFANLCLSETKKGGNTLIQNQDIAKARPAYSEYLVKELDDEIHEALPAWGRYLEVLRRVHKVRFPKSEFEAAFSALRLERYELSPDDALEMLYQFSVIGFTKIGGGGYGGSATAFRYRSPTVSFDPAAPYFNVHLGLKEALELVEAGE